MDVWVHIGGSAGRSTPPPVTSHGQDEFKFGRSTAKNKQQQFQYIMVYIYYGIYLAAILDSSRKDGISFYFWIIRVVNSRWAL